MAKKYIYTGKDKGVKVRKRSRNRSVRSFDIQISTGTDFKKEKRKISKLFRYKVYTDKWDSIE